MARDLLSARAMAGRGIVIVSVLLGAPAAHAWQVFAEISFRASVEITCRVTTGPLVQASAEGSTQASGQSSKSSSHQAEQADATPAEANPRACSSERVCVEGQVCVNGECELAPPPPPPVLLQREAAPEPRLAELQRRSTQVYLREHASQLRQDVALGAGPVISTLSSVEQVPAVKLGRVLRAHHAELLALIGDGADEKWPERFLQRVTELSRSRRA